MAFGVLTLGRWREAPLEVHWTAAIGAAFFSGFEVAPAFWAAFALVLAVHLFGHALMLRWFNLEPRALTIHGLGASVRIAGRPHPPERFGVAAGGVLLQLVLLAGALLTVRFLGRPSSPLMVQALDALTRANLWLLALNLLPIPPLDGAELWPALLRTLRTHRALTDSQAFDAIRVDYRRIEENQARREAAGEASPAIEAEAKEMWKRITDDIRLKTEKDVDGKR